MLAGPAFWFALAPGRLGGLAACVAVAGLSDLVDGTIARRTGSQSRVGAALDPVCDGAFFGAVAFGLAMGGAYPFWLAAVVALRYLLPVVAGAALWLAGRLPRLEHTFFGQVSTATIAVLLGGVALFRGLGQASFAAGIVAVAVWVIPAVTLLAWGDLVRAAARLARGGSSGSLAGASGGSAAGPAAGSERPRRGPGSGPDRID